MNDELNNLMYFPAVWLMMGLIGYAIGRARGRNGFGFFMGLLLGPIGWLIILVLPRRGRQCPQCLGFVPDQAVRCMHCASELPRQIFPRHESGGFGFLALMLIIVAGIIALLWVRNRNLTEAKRLSDQAACVSNLRQLESAVAVWALENRIHDDDSPSEQALRRYMQGQLPNCPAGGRYTIGSVSDRPTCSIPGHALPTLTLVDTN